MCCYIVCEVWSVDLVAYFLFDSIECGHVFFFFFKQKTAYEMCGRDWSSDVCSSDLNATLAIRPKEFRLSKVTDQKFFSDKRCDQFLCCLPAKRFRLLTYSVASLLKSDSRLG